MKSLCSVTLAATLLLGCGSSGKAPPPLLYEADLQAREGQRAYLTGEPARAIPPLRRAAQMHLAAGDLPGGARSLLNLALAERATGDTAAAVATADRLRELTPAAQQQASEVAGDAEPPAELGAASEWLGALLALDQGQLSLAADRLKPRMRGLRDQSPWRGRLETLRAELALAESRWTDALRHARAGQEASASAEDRAEEARALRLAGAAHMALAQWPEARTDLLSALRIEESLGGGARMVDDLKRLATVSDRLGDRSEARLYSQRARLIEAAR